MELKTIKLREIKPYENNPRRNDAAVDAVAESIKQCSYVSPIIIDEDGVILAGHTRYKALKKLGYTECEVIQKTGLTEEQKKKYRILDNKTNEFAEWDFDLLDLELEELDFEGFDFGLDEQGEPESAWEERKREFAERMQNGELQEDSEEYQEFLQKFEAKKTTDDCYTPESIYEAAANWVEKEYNVSKNNFVRPFYPGGDYQNYNYKRGDIVVDNPPFSILAEIVRFYSRNGIKFFLFAPTLTLFSGRDCEVTYIPTGATITYENGATVSTSFVTNMDTCQVRTASELYKALDKANRQNHEAGKKEMPKYVYPDHVITAAIVARWSKYGVEFRLERKDCVSITELDEQKQAGKAIFGGGYLLSERAAAERAAAERAAAERAAAERWQLSEREKSIIRTLGE